MLTEEEYKTCVKYPIDEMDPITDINVWHDIYILQKYQNELCSRFINELDKILDKAPLLNNIVLYRGINLSDNTLKTLVLKDRTYVSTSINKSVAKRHGHTILRISIQNIPIKGLYLESVISFKGEYEVLLPRLCDLSCYPITMSTNML